MDRLISLIARQSKKISDMTKIDELAGLSLKHTLGHILGSAKLLEKETGSEIRINKVILEHSIQDWSKKEAKNFAKLIGYIDNYLKYLRNAKAARNQLDAIKKLEKAKIFGILAVKQLQKFAELL